MEAEALDSALGKDPVLRAVGLGNNLKVLVGYKGPVCLVDPQFSLNISRFTARGQIWLHGEGTELGLQVACKTDH